MVSFALMAEFCEIIVPFIFTIPLLVFLIKESWSRLFTISACVSSIEESSITKLLLEDLPMLNLVSTNQTDSLRRSLN
jgi:hypothetical protein